MTPQEINDLIIIARRAPLANMTEAENVARLIEKFATHFLPPPAEPAPVTQDRPAAPEPTPAAEARAEKPA